MSRCFMKIRTTILLVFLTTLFVWCQEFDTHQYAVAKSGLNVRVMPELGAPKISKILYLTEVKILAETGVELSIVDEGETLSGQWIEIQFNDENNGLTNGFVFDQFVKSISFGATNKEGVLQISVITKNRFELLAQHLSLETLLDYDEYQQLIRQKDEDVIELYVKANSLKKQIDEEFNSDSRLFLTIDKLLSDLRGFEKNILGIYSSCVAECTDFSIRLRIPDFVKQSNDDRERIFFSILQKLAPGGDLKGTYHPIWTTPMCDYAGYSKLGNRLIYNNLKKIKAYLNEHTESEQDLSYKMLKTPRNTVIRQLSMRAYGSSQEKVVEELNDILRDNVLLDNEYYEVKEALAKAENGFIKYRNGQVEIEFACSTSRCTVCF
tara:strand:- start:18058 stop:19197 length:1140 start_codon:yes stop_codon:yes gene_type:complete